MSADGESNLKRSSPRFAIIHHKKLFIFLLPSCCGFPLFISFAGSTNPTTSSIIPAALPSSLIYLILELYILVRFFFLFSPDFLSLTHRLASLSDARICKTFSLLLFELLTIVQAVVDVSELAYQVPFCVGAIIVLGTLFNFTSSILKNSRS